MFEVVWMTALGFAMPAIGDSGDVLVDSGFARVQRTCGLATGENFISGFSHAVHGELFVLVHEMDGYVEQVDVIGGQLEGYPLFSADERCEDTPQLLFDINGIGVETTIVQCANGMITMRERGVAMGDGLCWIDDTTKFATMTRRMFDSVWCSRRDGRGSRETRCARPHPRPFSLKGEG